MIQKPDDNRRAQRNRNSMSGASPMSRRNTSAFKRLRAARRNEKPRPDRINALVGMSPRDECEGMIAAQLIACHHAAMESYRRAMLPEQPFEGWREQLNQANKLSRTYATLLEALNRHRGKGQQKVTVEHVHVHEGGQAIVGNVTPGGGTPVKPDDQPHAKQLTYAPGPPMPCADTTRDAVPIARDEERPLPDARRSVSRGSQGE